jgi:hypothetical protein
MTFFLTLNLFTWNEIGSGIFTDRQGALPFELDLLNENLSITQVRGDGIPSGHLLLIF